MPEPTFLAEVKELLAQGAAERIARLAAFEQRLRESFAANECARCGLRPSGGRVRERIESRRHGTTYTRFIPKGLKFYECEIVPADYYLCGPCEEELEDQTVAGWVTAANEESERSA